MHAEKEVFKISRSYKRFARQFLKMKAEMEDEAYMNMLKKDAREEGLNEGRAEGLKVGLNEGRAAGRKEGLQEGLNKGHKIGLEEGRLEIARRMKARGRSLGEITEDTGLSLEVVEKL